MTPEEPRRMSDAEPLTARDEAYWRQQVADRHVEPDIPWPDKEVIAVVARFLATLDAARLAAARTAASGEELDGNIEVDPWPAAASQPTPGSEETT